MSSIDKKNVTATSRNTAVLVSGVIGLICLWWFYPQIRAAMDPVREVPSAQDAAAPVPSDENGRETENVRGFNGARASFAVGAPPMRTPISGASERRASGCDQTPGFSKREEPEVRHLNSLST